MLKRAGFDQVVIDGRAERPVRLEAVEGTIRIVDAEDELFRTAAGRRTLRTASEVSDFLAGKVKGGSTLCAGPAGWNLVDFACLTADRHRNFGRGGAGAVFGSKNLVAITAFGKESVSFADEARFKELGKEIDRLVKESVDDPARTASFRPTTGTTWWLDRAFDGGYLGVKGGYLPWRNFDEGSFDERDYAKVSTGAFLEIAGKHAVCNKCRHIFCTRSARVEGGPYAGDGVRPEFETIALWINCCILDRDAMFHMNRLCNELGVDTMTFGSVAAGAMEMSEKGLLSKLGGGLEIRGRPRHGPPPRGDRLPVVRPRAGPRGPHGPGRGRDRGGLGRQAAGRRVLCDDILRRPRLCRHQPQGLPRHVHGLRDLEPRPRRPHLRVDHPGRGGRSQGPGGPGLLRRRRPGRQGPRRFARPLRLLHGRHHGRSVPGASTQP
jgi:hypothetical protein